MKVRRPIPRSGKPIKRSRIKKRPRKKAEKLRIYGPPGYVEWVHDQPCVSCHNVGASECAHIQTGGTGRKDDWTRTVPLCSHASPHGSFGCHRSLHNIGRETFERRRGIYLDQEAARIHDAWLSYCGEDTETT